MLAESTSFHSQGGYENDFVEPLPDSLICPICLLALRIPHILDCCGTRYCKSCIDPIKARNPATCPLCREQFTSIVDKQAQRLVLGLLVRCPRRGEGCEWKGELRALEKHESDTCEFCNVVCEYGCGAVLDRVQLLSHDCDKQPIEIQLEKVSGKFTRELEILKESHRKELTVMRDEFKKEIAERDKILTDKITQLEKESSEIKSLLSSLFPQPPCTVILTDYAQHKKQGTIWYSRPFYSSTGGYKMCLGVTARGVGLGRGTHVTVGVYLMRGEQDDNLSWPFTGAITVQLVNQLSNGCDNIEGVVNFTNQDKSVGERVITGERTKQGLGNLTFVSHSQVECVTNTTQYLMNDCLLLKITDIST